MICAYARVSTTDQSVDIQIDQLRAAGAEKIFAEQKSGTTVINRTALAECLEFCREGDTLIVTRLDRLARSVADLLQIVQRLNDKGVGFKCLLQPGIDTTSPSGKLFLTVIAAMSEFETGIRKERQLEGVAKAKAAGRYKGAVKRVPTAEIRRLRIEEGLGATEIAERCKVSRKTVYRECSDLFGNVEVVI